MAEEIELKLALSAEQLAKLKENELIRTLSLGRSQRRRLVTTYYDTPSQELMKREIALRVRESGRRRIQSLKARAKGSDGLQHFHEFETTISSETPDLTRVADPKLRDYLLARERRTSLAPVFRTEVTRETIPLRLGESEIELALDFGAIKAGEREASICEVELELMSGRPSRLYELALALNEATPLRLETRTKAARGYSLHHATRATVQRAVPIELPDGVTVGEGFILLLSACRDQLRANEAAAMAGEDPEGVHQLRVALRRARALIRLFRSALVPAAYQRLKGDLGWLQRALGPAREWDVFLEETVPAAALTAGGERRFTVLKRLGSAMKDQAYGVVRETLAGPRYTDFALRLDLWLDDATLLDGTPGSAGRLSSPLVDFARGALSRQDRRLRKLARNLADADDAALHRLRLEAKKLRYATEFFASLFPGGKAVRRTTKALAAIQTALGALNDGAATAGLLARIEAQAADIPHGQAKTLAWGLGVIAGWQAAAAATTRARVLEAWAAYEELPRFWR